MGNGGKVTHEEFDLVKKKLRWHRPITVSEMVGRGLAVILKIQACKSFDQYKKLVAAEHPPQTSSLTARVEAVERRVTVLEEDRERGKSEKALELNSDPS